MSSPQTLLDNPNRIVEHSDVEFSRSLIDGLILGLGKHTSDATFIVDNSRVGYEVQQLEFTDSMGREMQVRLTLRKRVIGSNWKTAVNNPQSYKDYHQYAAKFKQSIDGKFSESFDVFYQKAMTLTHRNWDFESESDIVESDGYFTFTLENKRQGLLLQVSVDIKTN